MGFAAAFAAGFARFVVAMGLPCLRRGIAAIELRLDIYMAEAIDRFSQRNPSPLSLCASPVGGA